MKAIVACVILSFTVSACGARGDESSAAVSTEATQAPDSDASSGTTAGAGSDSATDGHRRVADPASPDMPIDPPGLERLRDIGIIVGSDVGGRSGLASLAQATSAARSDQGGLVSPGRRPARASLALVRTATFGQTVGQGVDESVMPALDSAPGWVLIYEDMRIPVMGGRGPESAPSASPAAADPSAVPMRVVDMAVVVDARTGDFLFGRTL